MALTEKEILELLELDIDAENATPEDLQKAFNEKFISVKMAGADPRIIGRINGAMGQKLKKTFEPLVGGWEDGETDWSVPEKVAEAAALKLQSQREQYETLLAEAKKQSNAGNDKKLNDALEKLAQFEKDLQTEREMKEKISTDFKSYQETVAAEKKQFKLNSLLEEARKKVEFSDAVDELKMEGFNSILSRKYKHQLTDDEKGVLVIDVETGEPVRTPNGHSHDTWENVLKREAEAREMIKKNTGGSQVGSQQNSQQNYQQQNNNQQQGGYQRKMAPGLNVGVIE